MERCFAAKDKVVSNFSLFLLLLIMFIWFGIITVKTFPNIFVPIIKPTLKNANLGPNNLVKKNEIIISKINIISEKKNIIIN